MNQISFGKFITKNIKLHLLLHHNLYRVIYYNLYHFTLTINIYKSHKLSEVLVYVTVAKVICVIYLFSYHCTFWKLLFYNNNVIRSQIT